MRDFVDERFVKDWKGVVGSLSVLDSETVGQQWGIEKQSGSGARARVPSRSI